MAVCPLMHADVLGVASNYGPTEITKSVIKAIADISIFSPFIFSLILKN